MNMGNISFCLDPDNHNNHHISCFLAIIGIVHTISATFQRCNYNLLNFSTLFHLLGKTSISLKNQKFKLWGNCYVHVTVTLIQKMMMKEEEEEENNDERR